MYRTFFMFSCLPSLRNVYRTRINFHSKFVPTQIVLSPMNKKGDHPTIVSQHNKIGLTDCLLHGYKNVLYQLLLWE